MHVKFSTAVEDPGYAKNAPPGPNFFIFRHFLDIIWGKKR